MCGGGESGGDPTPLLGCEHPLVSMCTRSPPLTLVPAIADPFEPKPMLLVPIPLATSQFLVGADVARSAVTTVAVVITTEDGSESRVVLLKGFEGWWDPSARVSPPPPTWCPGLPCVPGAPGWACAPGGSGFTTTRTTMERGATAP